MKRLHALPALAAFAVLASVGVAGAAAPAPSSPDARSVAETQFGEWLTGQGVTVDALSSACGLAQVGEAHMGRCYAFSAATGTISYIAASPDGATWTFVDDSATAPAGGGEGASTFGDGTWIVGTDIQPGTYRTDVPEFMGTGNGLCSWKRLSGFTGSYEDTIEMGMIVNLGQTIVEVLPTDLAFESSSCGTWEPLG